uniref:Uncharacterized protein n=1 Tax=Brassica oleracea TaxID=3712 RepID=A0A3P6EI72_BRAOL|nr:unnamed protein product [Brassica oleracea]
MQGMLSSRLVQNRSTFASISNAISFFTKKCANLPRKKRHVCNNLPFTLHTDSHFTFLCALCDQYSTGSRYESQPHVIVLRFQIHLIMKAIHILYTTTVHATRRVVDYVRTRETIYLAVMSVTIH